MAIEAADHLADEMDDAISRREEGVVTTAGNVLAGAELGAALADDNRASWGGLALVELNAKALGDGIAA